MDTLQQDIAAAGYVMPTPIQAQCLLPAMEGKDIIGLAQTGTGKTAAFALPIIQRLAKRAELGALVLAPTRELAHQIVGVFHELGRSSGIRVACLVGGVKFDKDLKALRSWPNVIVATPGRLNDHLEQKTVSLKEIEVLVVDEADRMHDMGFIPQIRRIIAHLPAERQTMMFTATMPADVEQIARKSMRDPIKVQIGLASRPVERAEQRLFDVHETQKVPLLLSLLKKETGRVLVFVRTKRGVDRLARRVRDRDHEVARLHGDREQNQRDEAMSGFREGRYRVMIATDIAARGLDVDDIEHVINYDFPRSPEDYVHRIGRTARLEASGKATSFVTGGDRALVRDLEKLVKVKYTLEPPPAGTPEADHSAPLRAHSSHGQGQGRVHGRGGRSSGYHGRDHKPQSSYGHGRPAGDHGAHARSYGAHAHQPHGAKPELAAAGASAEPGGGHGGHGGHESHGGHSQPRGPQAHPLHGPKPEHSGGGSAGGQPGGDGQGKRRRRRRRGGQGSPASSDPFHFKNAAPGETGHHAAH
jgi:ATP-dependent RNA helicase RhlE